MTAEAASGGAHPLTLFRFPILASIAGIVITAVFFGAQDAGIVAILGILEISLSFDNAVVNATVLRRMDERWQRIFLTVGIVIAVFGMRLVFPIIIVAISGHLTPVDAVNLAVNHPSQYADKLTAAHPSIAAFGGIFLLMIFLDFLFEDREITWLGYIERPLARIGRLESLSTILSLALLIVAATTFASDHAFQVLVSGAAGLATYLGVSSLSSLFEGEDEEGVDEAVQDGEEPHINVPKAVAKAGIYSFLYLEVLDASFSFDGVVGAFAITDKIFIIAVGLGIGAAYIRGLTVYLVRKGTLDEYVHLEHGAHWAIGALAIILFVSITHAVPEVVTGLVGIGFIGAALVTSIVRNRRGGGGSSDPSTQAATPAAVS